MLKTSYWYRFHPFYLSFSPGCDCLRVFWSASCTSARHAGSFDCLKDQPHSDYNGQWQMALCILAVLQSSQPNPQRNEKKHRNMYAIKQIKICAEYRDMLPRPRLDLSGAPGLRPIGLSPGSWQTSLGLGSMSRYSAQILICIIYIYIYIYIYRYTAYPYALFDVVIWFGRWPSQHVCRLVWVKIIKSNRPVTRPVEQSLCCDYYKPDPIPGRTTQ